MFRIHSLHTVRCPRAGILFGFAFLVVVAYDSKVMNLILFGFAILNMLILCADILQLKAGSFAQNWANLIRFGLPSNAKVYKFQDLINGERQHKTVSTLQTSANSFIKQVYDRNPME